jgi:predicted hydrolase (HD superfamily)
MYSDFVRREAVLTGENLVSQMETKNLTVTSETEWSPSTPSLRHELTTKAVLQSSARGWREDHWAKKYA